MAAATALVLGIGNAVPLREGHRIRYKSSARSSKATKTGVCLAYEAGCKYAVVLFDSDMQKVSSLADLKKHVRMVAVAAMSVMEAVPAPSSQTIGKWLREASAASRSSPLSIEEVCLGTALGCGGMLSAGSDDSYIPQKLLCGLCLDFLLHR